MLGGGNSELPRPASVSGCARAAAKEVFEVSRHFPREEKFSLTDQIRRASRSVAANIAEAWRKRRYQAAFVSKLSDADGEAAEVCSWPDMALDCAYINCATFDALDKRYDHVAAQLRLMMDEPEKWCPAPRIGRSATGKGPME